MGERLEDPAGVPPPDSRSAFPQWATLAIRTESLRSASSPSGPARRNVRTRPYSPTSGSYDTLLPDGPATRDHELLTMRSHGEPVANLWVFHNDAAGETFVYDVVVSAAARGRGYGRAIMREASLRAAAQGLDRVRLDVHEGNQRAIGMYQELGYRTATEIRLKELA